MMISSKVLVELVLLGPAGDRRQLQDSPVLGDVWLAYGARPHDAHDLLITPQWNHPAGPVAKLVADRLGAWGVKKGAGTDVAYLHGLVAAKLRFRDLLRVIVPMTVWWKERGMTDMLTSYATKRAHNAMEEEDRLEHVLEPILTWAKQIGSQGQDEAAREKATEDCMKKIARFSALKRYMALAGVILWADQDLEKASRKKGGDDPSQTAGAARKINPASPKQRGLQRLPDLKSPASIVNILVKLFAEVVESENAIRDSQPPGNGEPVPQQIYQVSLNRKALPALMRSVPAVKGDAARTVFNVKCGHIGWAVLDSGIQRNHPAFNQKEADGKTDKMKDYEPLSRVVRAYDFAHIRKIVSLRNRLAEHRKACIDELLERNYAPFFSPEFDRKTADADLERLANDAANDRPIDWGVVEKYITIDGNVEPNGSHGTHVAGIIGAGPTGGEEAEGMCPDIQLYDFRVLADSVKNTEFGIIAALQFIQYLNFRQSFVKIHGANLSLSIPHDVRNFACGRTPICVECTRLVDSGVVVVAAAGNLGYHSFETKDGFYDGYAAFSITDPGNADDVVTVGATHRDWPHTFGVSFFSSRGPTGDGRIKPDIVAPGERIRSSILQGGWGELDGTSMAAPHVSGAAGMLMARYPELVGQPRKIKRILCESATDLGRERTFQGHGMLDVLRAFQKI